MKLNINANAVIGYTIKLENLSKYALPVAIRTALNSTAFDVKTNTMPNSAKIFIKRSNNFFKANSKVEVEKGFIINKMASKVGFFENKLKNQATNYAVKDLEQQELGGAINSKTFIAMKGARINNKMVRPNNRLREIKANKIIAQSSRGRNNKEQFIRASAYAFKAYGIGALVLGNKNKNGNKTLYRITKLSFNKNKTSIGVQKLYNVKDNRSVNVKGTHFMLNASNASALKMEGFYINEAKKQINKLKK